MRQSEFFLKIRNDFPKDEEAENARLLIRGNFVDKLMAGVYSFLPLGFLVREKIIRIIREEMNALGGEEVLLPALHPKSAWEPSGRWETLAPIMYRFKDHSGKDVGLGTTHEEIVAAAAKSAIVSYGDLPRALYQIQTKFRDEPRAKSGLLRGREFTMKDLYSFHADADSLDEFYEKAKSAYLRVFSRCGLDALLTEASGGDFSDAHSHEFMVESSVGEDSISICRKCHLAVNAEVDSEGKCPSCGGKTEAAKGIEVGNIFRLGTKFSEAAGLLFRDRDGSLKPVIMASYGIGVERLMGTIVEIHHDEKGIVWPDAVAPFSAHLLLLGAKDEGLQKLGDQVYSELSKKGVSVLFDDTDASPGEKLFSADFLGIPNRIVVSQKAGDKVEFKRRNGKETELLSLKELISKLAS